MSTCNAFYVFADGNFDTLSDMLASQYPRAKIEATATFLSCTLSDDDQEFFFGTLQDDGVDNAEAQRIWDAAEILAGRCVPLVLAKECAIAIAEYYGVLE